MIPYDRLGCPIYVNDIVMFSKYEDTVLTNAIANWYEAEVLEIYEDYQNAVGSKNYEIRVRVKHFSTNSIDIMKQIKDNIDVDVAASEYSEDQLVIQSNMVINKTIITQALMSFIPEEFI